MADDSGVVETPGAGDSSVGRGPAREILTPLSEDRAGVPVVVIHGASGGIRFARHFAGALDAHPVFGIAAMGSRSGERPDTTIGQMADRYASAVVGLGHDRVVLAGYSGGGLVALEMAARLRAAGVDPMSVVLLDSAPPGLDAPARALRLGNMLRHLRSSGPGPMTPYVQALVDRRITALRAGRAVEPEPLDAPDAVDLYDFFETVAAQHVLGTYDADVVLVRAINTWPMMPPDYYWAKHLARTFSVVDTPGDHLTMFSPELAPALAGVVGTQLARIGPT